jgi:hypothetical protein
MTGQHLGFYGHQPDLRQLVNVTFDRTAIAVHALGNEAVVGLIH